MEAGSIVHFVICWEWGVCYHSAVIVVMSRLTFWSGWRSELVVVKGFEAQMPFKIHCPRQIRTFIDYSQISPTSHSDKRRQGLSNADHWQEMVVFRKGGKLERNIVENKLGNCTSK